METENVDTFLFSGSQTAWIITMIIIITYPRLSAKIHKTTDENRKLKNIYIKVILQMEVKDLMLPWPFSEHHFPSEFSVIQWNISAPSWWIGTNFSTVINSFQTMYANWFWWTSDSSCNATTRSIMSKQYLLTQQTKHNVFNSWQFYYTTYAQDRGFN